MGGAERVFSTLLKNINRNDFDIVLAIGAKTGGFLDEVPEDIKVVELSGSKRAIKSFFPLLKLIRHEKPNVVFSTLGMVSASSLCSFFTDDKITYIARFGNTISADLYRSKRDSYPKYLFQKMSYFLVLKRCKIVTQSLYMKRDLVDYFSISDDSDIHVIYNPAPNPSVSRFISNINEEKKIVTVGRFAWQKGYDILIDSLDMLAKDGKKFKFYFIGGGNKLEEQIVKEKAARANLADVVQFLGEQEQPFSSVTNIDFFVSSSRFEGFANVILESLANGIPVVATDCPSGNREVIKNGVNGWLTEQEGSEPTPRELYDTISRALETADNIDREQIKEDVRNTFAIGSAVSNYEALFSESMK